MRLPRIFIPDSLLINMELALPDEARRHLIQVLKLAPGSQLWLFNGQGGQYRAEIIDSGKRHLRVKVLAFDDANVESPLQTILVQGVSKGPRMDFVMQKATELGVSLIQPVSTQHSVVKLEKSRQDKKQQHWQSVVISACEQSGRNSVPEVAPVCSLQRYLDQLDGTETVLFLDPDAASTLAALNASPPVRLVLLIGPEGGFSDAELAVFHQRGFTGVRMGPRIFRTETAALATLVACQLHWGDLA